MSSLSTSAGTGLRWSEIRIAAGAVVATSGTILLILAGSKQVPAWVAMGVMLTSLGFALCSERTAEAVALPCASVVAALVLFSIFVICAGFSAPKVLQNIYIGAFGSWFSFQNTLARAAPLMLTGLCTALPIRAGLVIIGGEGALVIGALFSAAIAHEMQNAAPWLVTMLMLSTGFVAGGLWIASAGALKHYRAVNETISSLLLIYIAIALMNHLVEGPWRDPESLNKPSTWPIGDQNMLGTIPGMDVHWGLLIGVVACGLCWILTTRTTFGFAARIIGGNPRAAKLAGLPLGRVLLISCLIGGGAAGLAGAIEIAAVQGSCNYAVTMAGYGYTGILVAFLARHNPLGIIPVAILLGGIGASGDLLQQNLQLPDAALKVLQGTIFLILLASESYYGRFRLFAKKEDIRG